MAIRLNIWIYSRHRYVMFRYIGPYKMPGRDQKTCLNSTQVIWVGDKFELSFLASYLIKWRYENGICCKKLTTYTFKKGCYCVKLFILYNNCFLNLNPTSIFQATVASFILFSFIPSIIHHIGCNDHYFFCLLVKDSFY